MPPLRRLARLAYRPHLPRRTVRLRLTLMYGALFLASGAGVLAVTYLLVNGSPGQVFFFNRSGGTAGVQIQATKIQVAPAPGVAGGLSLGGGESAAAPTPGGGQSSAAPLPGAGQDPAATIKQAQAQAHQLRVQATSQRSDELHQLLVKSGIALGMMAVVSIALGWLIAGRVLRPLRTMTVATRRISEHNLHERLDLRGPDDELKDLADTIDGLLARLEAAFEAQRRFVANASHELRTPLAMMRTSLDVAVAKPEPLSPQVGVLEGKLREGLDQADRLLESFLMLARAQHGALSEQTTVSLAQVAAAAIRARADEIGTGGIEVRRALLDAPVAGSETLLARMVENVIENAVRHNEPAGWMCVRTGVEARLARMVVESAGPPLEESKVRELAQPFRRLGADRTGSEKGVGLGLSIVAAIVAAHGGMLELHARREGGLRVEVLLPAAERAMAPVPATAVAPA